MSAYQSEEALAAAIENNFTGLRYAVFYYPGTDGIYVGKYSVVGNSIDVPCWSYVTLSNANTALWDSSTTLTETPSLDQEKTEGMTLTIPASVPTTMVGGLSVPVYGDLTADDLIGTGEREDNPPADGAVPWDKVLGRLEGIDNKVGALPGAISDALSGAMANTIADSMASVIAKADAQQQTVENSIAEPDSLGAVFISKFPFCIPWDIVQAIKLLAAPPVPPRFEVDMYSAMEGYGGFHSSTPVVIDFEPLEPAAVIVRWASMVGFIYCLAMGTKKLIWTA